MIISINEEKANQTKTCLGYVHWKLQNADERYQRVPIYKERDTVFMDWKTPK